MHKYARLYLPHYKKSLVIIVINVVLFIAFFFLGIFYATFSLAKLLRNILCAFPLTCILSKANLLISNRLYLRVIKMIVYHLLFGCAIFTILFKYLSSSSLWGFMVGTILLLLFLLKECRITDVNAWNFLEKNKACINTSTTDINVIFTYIMTL